MGFWMIEKPEKKFDPQINLQKKERIFKICIKSAWLKKKLPALVFQMHEEIIELIGHEYAAL